MSVLSLARPAVPVHFPRGVVREGDLVFRRGPSLLSRIVLSADSESAYSHVGIIQMEDGEPWVVHTSVDEPEEPHAGIRIEPLERFLAPDRAEEAAFYRLKPEFRGFAAEAVRRARAYYRNRVPFDSNFDLSSEAELYCTELVWRAYSDAGLDLVDGEFRYLRIPFRQGYYLLPSDLLSSSKLLPVQEANPRRNH